MTLIRSSVGSDGVHLVTLDRPDRLNALTFEMFQELRAVLAEIDSDPSARAVIITGSGRGFCAGLDLDDAERLPGMTASEMMRGQETWADAITFPQYMRTPVIAAVNGPAAGAGFSLALAADVRVASAAARFNAAFVRIGLSGGDCGSSWLLPRIIGYGLASELLLTGRMVEPAEALRIGLVNQIAEDGDLLEAAMRIAGQIAANSSFGVRLTKQVLRSNVDAPSLESAVEIENRNQVLATRSDEMVEALGAFRSSRR